MAFLRQELAIDLGTANTVIFKDDTVVLDEPSIIATDTKTGRLVGHFGAVSHLEWYANGRLVPAI